MVNLEVINDLWLQIDKLHLSCLQTEESPQRIEQKRKLKGNTFLESAKIHLSNPSSLHFK